MSPDTTNNTLVSFLRRYRGRIILLIFLALGVYVGLFVYSHGVINMETDASTTAQRVSSTATSDTSRSIVKKGRTIVPSGDYLVTSTFSDGTQYTKYVQVGHFLKTTNYSSKKTALASVSQVAAQVGDYLVPNGSGYSSIEDGLLYTHSRGDPLGVLNATSSPDALSGVDSMVYYAGDRLLGLSRDDSEEGVVLKVGLINSSNGTVSLLPHTPTVSMNSYVVAGPDSPAFAVYDQTGLTVYLFANTEAAPSKITLKKPAAIGNGQPLITLSNSSLIVGRGSSYQSVSETESSGDRSSVYTIDTYNLSGKALGSVSLPDSDLLQSIAVNQSGNFLATLSDSSLLVYRLTGAASIPERTFGVSQANIGSTGWLDDDTFFYGLDSSTLQAVSVKEGSSYSLFHNSHVTVSTAHASAGKVYFTGFYASDSLQNLYGFVVDPAATVTKEQAVYLERFPYASTYYKLGAVDGSIYIYPTRSFYLEGQSRTAIINAANQYIKQYLPEDSVNTTFFP